jgi:hypothetical protein
VEDALSKMDRFLPDESVEGMGMLKLSAGNRELPPDEAADEGGLKKDIVQSAVSN